MLAYPAISFFKFFDNHRLMHKERPKWRTVTGGSQSYVRKVAADLGDRVQRDAEVVSVARFGAQIAVRTADGAQQVFGSGDTGQPLRSVPRHA